MKTEQTKHDMVISFEKKQIQRLRRFKDEAFDEWDSTIFVSDFVRDGTSLLIKEIESQGLESYLESKKHDGA